MSGLMMHAGGEVVTLDQVRQVPVPAHTKTWRPVAYGDAIDYVKDKAVKLMGAEIEDEVFGLSKDGAQMFGALTLATGQGGRGLSIGLRASYNKTLSNAVAIGAHVFVCDNLCFSTNGVKILRKNTVNVWPDFTRMVREQMTDGRQHHDAMEAEIKRMEAFPVHNHRGYELLGAMAGYNLLKPRQLTVAMADWNVPRHDEFAPRTLWSLYNCVTEGLKKGGVGGTIERHTNAHDFLVSEMD